MKKRGMLVAALGVLFFCLLFTEGFLSVAKAEIEWDLDSSTGTLTISGSGKMKDYSHYYSRYPEWYSSRSSIKTVIIDDGITYIGKDAFRKMPALEQVVMADSVIELADYCFSDCDSLQYIDFSPNIEKVRDWAFSGCDGLESVIFPRQAYDFASNTSSMYNGWSMFNNCKNLKYVEFPENWKTIFALQNCPSLEEIVFPSAITQLKSFTFSNSTIREITIPTTVTTLPWCTFSECSVGKMVIPQTVTYLETYKTYWWFDNPKDFNCMFYVVEGSAAHQWFQGRSYFKYTLVSPTLNEIEVPSDEICFLVNDEEGKPIYDATVTYNGTTSQTNGSGVVYFMKQTNGSPTVTIEKNGYETWSNGDKWSWKNPALYQITLYQSGTNGLKVSSAIYEGENVLHEVDKYIDYFDLTKETKKIFISTAEGMLYKPGDGKFRIDCTIVNPSLALKYELIQGSGVIQESRDGLFRLQENQFTAGGKYFIRVYDKNGDHYDTPINLVVEESKIKEEKSFQFDRGEISVTLDDEFPLVGGHTFKFDITKVFNQRLHFVVSDSGIEVGVNLKLGDDPKKTMQDAKNFVGMMEKAGGLKIGKMTKSQKNTFDKLVATTQKADFFSKADVSFLGYGKYNTEENKVEVNLVVTFSTGANFSQTFMVVVVPVVVSAKLDLSAAASVNLYLDLDTNETGGSLKLSPKAKLTGFAGVGVGDLVGAGVYGSLELSGSLNILPEFLLETIDLEGELGLKAYIGPFEHEKAFAYQHWNLYSKDETYAQSIGNGDPYGLFDSSQYRRSNWAYLQGESGWLGIADPDRIGAMNSAEITDFQPLLTGTYRNAQPQMISTGDKVYATFLKANEDATGIQAVVTRFDGISWSAPVAADANACADNAPMLCVDQDGVIWLAYARTNNAEAETLREYAESQSIIIGRVDPETLAFQPVQEYASPNYAHNHKLTTVNGKATLVWLDSVIENDNDVLWPDENTIYTASCGEDNEWPAAATAVSEVEGPVTDLAAGSDGNGLRIGYYTDIDGSFATKEDIALYETTGEETALVAENCGGKLKLVRTAGAAAPLYAWNKTDALCFSDGTEIAAEGISKEFIVMEDRIYYSADTDGRADLFVMYYDAETGTWSNPVQLTKGERYFESISVVEMNGQYYTMGMHTGITIAGETVTDDKNLVWAQIRNMNDLCLADAAYDKESLVPGEDMTVTLFIDNMGDHDVKTIQVEETGMTYACEIPQGTTGEVEITLPCPERLTEYTFTVNEPGETDATPANNSFSLLIGYSDLSLTARLNKNNGKYSILAVVENAGIEPTRGTVTFRGSDGTEYAHAELKAIKAGGIGLATLEIDEKIMPGFDLDVFVTVESEKEDWTDVNNSVEIKESFDAIEGTCGTNAKWSFARNGVLTITGGGVIRQVAGNWPWQRLKSRIQAIHIAEGIAGIQGSNAFSGIAAEEILLPDSMADCGTYTFSGCSGLTTFTMPLAAESVGDGLFSQCINLEQVTLSENTTAIGNQAFYGCTSLEEVIGTEQVTGIGYAAFSGCLGLEEFTMPTAIGIVPDDLFSQCTNLQRVALSENTTAIGHYAFSGCTSLEEVTGTGQVTSIGFDAFDKCTNLTTFAFSENPVSIMDMAFAGSGLTRIELNNGTIGYYAFGECPALAEATIGIGVTQIEYGAFSNCGMLGKVDFLGDDTLIQEVAFGKSNSVVFHCRNTSSAYTYAKENSIPYVLTNEKLEAGFMTPGGTKVIEEEAFAGGGFTAVKLNDGLETIGSKAFAECGKMIQIEIPASVKTIDEHAFDDHNSLLIIFCTANSDAYQFAVDQGIDYILTETQELP